MVVSRLAAFALAATMLHLSVARADASCAAHGGHAAATQPHSQGVGHPEGTPSDTQCDTPSQPDCCEALVSCTVHFGPCDGVERVLRADVLPSVVVAVAGAPVSRTSAPEPPPPRR